MVVAALVACALAWVITNSRIIDVMGWYGVPQCGYSNAGSGRPEGSTRIILLGCCWAGGGCRAVFYGRGPAEMAGRRWWLAIPAAGVDFMPVGWGVLSGQYPESSAGRWLFSALQAGQPLGLIRPAAVGLAVT